MAESTLQTTLYSTHLAMGARTVPFGGWDMPVQYSGILAEVNAVRTDVGVFDVSHMGRLYISGTKSTEFLDWVLTGSAQSLAVGRARYCFICNESGGVIDDTIFYRLEQDRFLLIPNAGNRVTVVDWFQRWIAEKFPTGCQIVDRTMDTALIAVQGPRAAGLLDACCLLDSGAPLSSLRMFSWGEGIFAGEGVIDRKLRFFAGRTGYTGEDGFELVVASGDAETIWKSLVDAGALPCGLGARDVLRLEAGLPLHGHEIDENTSPIEAGLKRFVRSDKEFVGSAALGHQLEHGVKNTLVGLTLPGRSAPRAEYPILDQGQQVGQITSGSYSPTLDTSIAMGYVLERHAILGQTLDIDIRGRISPGKVVPLPFYSRAK
ncbi:MAG TPA: glycine cleavage system aminomethyltransferase GcvT [Dehalococcoidia bacterium]|nr:glycine cleavage system aminomethyltransferase GcvT [Dehalococcoidia bacterium]